MLIVKLSMRCLLVVSLVLLAACQQMPFKKAPDPVEPERPELTEPAVCECPSPVEPAPVQSCPPPKTIIKPKQCKPVLFDDLLMIGRVEWVFILPDKLRLKARIDTGAGISSLHAADLVEFDRDGKPWVKFLIPMPKQKAVPIERPVRRYVEIKQLSGKPQRRPVVSMTLKLGPVEEQVEVTLTDRSDYLYQLLIGRNFLRDRAIVDVSRRFTIKTRK